MDFKESKAIYLQIADYLMGKIAQNDYKVGERIPSVRECAADLEVNVNTCMRAYDWLCQQQVIFTKRGLGYFVCEGATQAILNEQRKEFLTETLPEIAKKMKALGLTPDDILDILRQ